MTPALDASSRRLYAKAFRMPSIQTMVSRKSSITNAFVSAIIPVIQPTVEEIAEALSILQLDPLDLRCAYCGDKASEWDHLRPLVLNRRPTGFISEIANLVPSCGKCNQSKGNKDWRTWMLSSADLSPTGRGIGDVQRKIELLEAYESWRKPRQIDIAQILGSERWDHYWHLCEDVIKEMAECQLAADEIKREIMSTLVTRTAPG
jgi:hypothetical protein